ncbi:sushi, von Willebrand factor type A, EGF and pentraxin domain-containing protein 1-like isoform X2 [Stegodyphus dumicola]|uniref:sushi, von Willebrand factor type A, EGF and pentraxin domain-containing protein 1-like isoform X2 n=1 Tax=Stegodyphus dumicola TaxID=202533 RepID=UPI0015AF0868|nr:sushi, von Willebrand factor type A, EGF and pentraxin domain-containing protein 1-like isoform X2 [Stegodyphus dumicola]
MMHCKIFILELLCFVTCILKSSLCDEQVCGKPPDIINGKALLQDLNSTFLVGTNITYTCNDGYVSSSTENAYSFCLSDNETAFWQPPVMSCEPVCNDLPVIANGELRLEGLKSPFRPGDSINYVCNSGYLKESTTAKLICSLKDGVASWPRTERACRPTSCNDPGYIENAERIGHLFTFPNNVTYVCNEGYKLKGVATRFCSAKGQWLPNATPSCEAIVCPSLNDPQNGKVIFSQKRLHSVATYKCDRNFILSGLSERTCQADGTWSGSPPVCKEINCSAPETLKNMRALPNKSIYKAGDLVIFQCKSGGVQKTAKCLDTGEWNVHPPHCPDIETEPPVILVSSPATTKVNLCDDPGEIKNGARTLFGLNVNSTIVYHCDEGYELRGKSTLLCLENGKWDLDKLPICVKPISTLTIIGIVFGIIFMIGVAVGGYILFRWREKKIRGYGQKSKALTADATDLEEITGLDKGKKPVPVTVL